MAKIASLASTISLVLSSVTLSAMVSVFVPGPARAYTPDDVIPITLAAQPFNITRNSLLRFVFAQPDSPAFDPSDIVDIQLHRRVSNLDSFRSIASGAATVRVIDTFSTTVRNVPRDPDGRLAVTTAASMGADSTASLSFSIDGIYPVTVRVRDAQTNTTIASTLTFVHKRLDPVSTQVPVSAVVRLIAAPSVRLDGTVSITDETRNKVRDFTAFLATFAAPLTISVQPEIVSSLALSTEPGDAQLLANLAEQLRRFTVVTSTFAATDVSMYEQANLDDEFIEQLRLGESMLARYLPQTPIQRNTWIADTPITAAGAQLLRKAGMASVILMPPAQGTVSYSSARALLHRPEGRPADYLSVVSVEPTLSAGLSGADALADPVLAGHHVAAAAVVLVDDLRTAGQAGDPVALAVSTSSGGLVAGDALSVAARALSGAPGLITSDMSTPYPMTSGSPVAAFRAQAPIDADSRGRDIAVMRQLLDATASMTAPDDPQRDRWASLLALGESSVISDPKQYFDALGESLRSIRQSVTINTPDTITLSGRNSIIRLQLRNNSTSTLTVLVRLSSSKLDLDDPVRTVTLSPESTQEVEVPAEALSNGRFPISISVTTPTGEVDVVSATTITARVNALAGYGQLVSISLLLVLGAWWWSNWRKGKLAAAGAATVSR